MRGFQNGRGRRLIKEGSWLIIGNVMAVVASLALVRVLTEKLDPAQFGGLSLGLTVGGLVNQVVLGGLTQGIGRFYSIAAEKREVGVYLSASWRLMRYATLVVVVLGSAVLLGMAALGYFHWMGLAVAALVFSVVAGYNGVLSDVQNAARQRSSVAVHGVLNAWLKILLAVGVMAWLGASGTAVVIGYILSAMVVGFSQWAALRRALPASQGTTDPGVWMSRIWAYSWPFSAWGIFTWVQQSSDRWALQAFVSTTEVGHYAVLFQLGYSPTAVVIGLAMSFLGPILFQRSGDATDRTRNANVHELVWKITGVSLMATMLAFIAVYGLHDWLFGMLVAPEYRGSSYLLPWVVLAGGFFAAGQVISLKLMSEMKSSVMTGVKIGTALLGTLFNIVGAKVWGIHGIIVAQLAFSGVYFIWMVVLGSKSSASVEHA